MTRQQLLTRKAEIAERILCLECGDDGLFSNANGNYPLYKSLLAEQSEISKQLGAV